MQAFYRHPFILLRGETREELLNLGSKPWLTRQQDREDQFIAFYTRSEQIREELLVTDIEDSDRLPLALSRASSLTHIPDWDRSKVTRYFASDMQPRDYQADGLYYLLTEKKVVIGDEMGLGKTLQSAGAVNLHAHANPQDQRPTLILCPAGLRYQWRTEITRMFVDPATGEQTYTSGDFAVLDGPPKKRDMVYRDKPPFWVIINYELLLRDQEKILKWLGLAGLRGLILDESSRIKNEMSRSWGASNAVVKELNPELLYLLNATPIENSLQDLWAQLRVVNPYIFPSVSDFTNRYINSITFSVCRKCGKYKPSGKLPTHAATCQGTGARWRPDFTKITGYDRLDEVNSLIRPVFIRRTCSMVQEQLPQIVVVKHEVVLSDAERREYNTVFNDPDMDGLARAGELVRRATYYLKGEKQVASSKMDALPELMEQIGENKVLMVSESRVFVLAVEAFLRKKGFSVASIHSSVEVARRDEIVRNFTKGNLQIVVGTSAIERGLNLQSASWVINLDLPWNPAKWFQRVGRARRIGSVHAAVKVVNMIASQTIEQGILEAVYGKLDLFNAVFDGDFSGTDLEGVDLDTIPGMRKAITS